eukprot:TRINITY_DN34552_c0_g1_i1.p1 TRINITY_DN34552_c0_g1~~TRINITY_DN34552_c0_g1_i1.p1  ORF type:complete len:114 (+),score=19.62 TRINITY_DN34552_c0_g1_i1:36-377(+)
MSSREGNEEAPLRRREHPLHEATAAMTDEKAVERVKHFQNNSIIKMAQMSAKLAAFNRMSEATYPELKNNFEHYQTTLAGVSKDLVTIDSLLQNVRGRLVNLGGSVPRERDDG